MSMLQRLKSWLGESAPLHAGDTVTHGNNLLASLLSMAWFVEARDPYTGGHLWRVSRYAWLLARDAGLTHAQAARAGLGGFLHDLGKVGVSDAILRKSGKLSDDEYDIIKTHPDIGMRMLAGHPLAHLVADAVLLHHERPDGRGYPRGLAGEAIPEIARIVGICDAFDAMTSQRPYRAGMPRDQAIAIIREFRGTQFDARHADRFVALGERGELDHIMGHSDDGIPLQDCPMCGPTLVLRHEHRAGDKLYCRNCTGEFELQEHDHRLVATPTGKQGKAADLEPEVDSALIARTVQQAIKALPVADLLRAASSPGG